MLPHKIEYGPFVRYIMEATGLGIFMVSIAVFGTYFLSPLSPLISVFPNEALRVFFLSLIMAATAVFITISPVTSPSGAHINPAVTLCFLRLGRISKKDAFFYIVFQLAGGTLAVYLMAYILQDIFTQPPVNYAVTRPGVLGTIAAFITELIISAGLMALILFGNSCKKIRTNLPLYIGILIFIYVNATVKISGFSMNPARSFASAFPSGSWRFYWIYLIAPVTGMLAVTEFYKTKTSTYVRSSQ